MSWLDHVTPQRGLEKVMNLPVHHVSSRLFLKVRLRDHDDFLCRKGSYWVQVGRRAESRRGIATSITPPDGFVSDFELLEATPTNEIEVVQFIVTEFGSEYEPTETQFDFVHLGGRDRVNGKVDIYLTVGYAQSMRLDVEELQERGLIYDRILSHRGDVPEGGKGKTGASRDLRKDDE